MPFTTDSEGSVIWDGSSVEFESEVLDKILNNREENVEVSVNEELQNKLQNHLSQTLFKFLPGQNRLGEGNEHLYSSLTNMVSGGGGYVDIVLPVHGSMHIVEPCIESVLKRTYYPYHLYIIDDASDNFTNTKLQRIAESNKDKITLITNKKNKGFAASVNRGIKRGNGKYICLLNSDVLVTPKWLTKLVLALEADERNQIVNPATNNTAQIAVPLSPGASYLDMNTVLEKYSQRRYPEIMPTGFLFMFKRSLVEEIGLFDESYFNYGEESDFWMRTITQVGNGKFRKYRAVMADDTYVFHERGSSFSALGNESHMGLRSAAAGRFHASWPQYSMWAKGFNVDKTLGPLRQPIPTKEINSSKKVPYRICWVVHSAAFCGGMKLIADIVNRINELGGDARVALIKRNPEDSAQALGELRTGLTVFEDVDDFLTSFKSKVFQNGFVVAATVELLDAVNTLCGASPKLSPILHTQSFEPSLITDKKIQEKVTQNFKTAKHVISSSGWVTSELEKLGVEVFGTVVPGVDTNLFYPRGRENGDERPTIMIPIMTNYPYRGSDRALKLVKTIWNESMQRGVEIRILTYGADKLSSLGTAIALGGLAQPRLAKILGTEVDIFIDPSYIHSYGMPALEAMASGVAVVSWDNRGIREYVKQGRNGLIFKRNAPVAEVAKGVMDLLEDKNKRQKFIKNGLETVREHNRSACVDKFIETFEAKFSPVQEPKKITFVTPHFRKHGGPTTIMTMANEMAKRGHDVKLLTIYDDINPEVIEGTDLPIYVGSDKVPFCDVLFVNSDNPLNKNFSELNAIKSKVLLKLSHNERFKELEESSLNLKWDKIVTSTNWLAEQCKNPAPGWNHPSVDATRVGWWHYGHDLFKCNPNNRSYGDGFRSPVKIGMLVHQHPLKGTQEAIDALIKIKTKLNQQVSVIGVGEIPAKRVQVPNWIKYHPSLNREQMAKLFKEVDIWLGASQTEGLGRMALEAMSAGVACVLSDTKPEFARDGENCLLYPIGDTDMAAKHVLNLINYPDLRESISMGGFKTAEGKSNPQPCIDNLERILKEIT